MTELGARIMPHRAPATPGVASNHSRPQAISVAFLAIIVALLAGVCETLMRLAALLEQPDVQVGPLLPGLAVRVAIYTAVYLIAVRMTAGAGWARTVLVLGLGIIGLASLLIEPVTAVVDADSLAALTDGVTPGSVVIGFFRAVHVVAVLVAVPAMLSARNYFRR
ncbi:hypothetical protein JK358_16550 [Nocardia sp. 2]|uniref:Uncharacterized protein n=1 Tax=Nocardia acididurans TaxID=2802282 RepID=A0ABS1M716_9NOCA|nr:hypothetical protein [Nocardia acididurans]MBL1076009.1 hypothetical protein [Nocardia acididurans]